MLSALLITLREGIEAALVIGIIFAYLARTGNRRAFRPVWSGTVMGLLGSVAAGVVIYLVAGEFSGKPEMIFEGSTLFVAGGVLTWMIFWMREQAVNISTQLHAEIQGILARNSSWGLVTLAFVVVIREGIEAVLFLFAATSVARAPLLSFTGGLLGLVLAVIIGYTIYKGTSRMNLRTFFNVTSVVLIVFAAGLFAHAFGEFHEAGIVPLVVEHVWDTSRILAEDSTAGQFVAVIVGYIASPSLVQVIVYFLYVALALGAYFRPAKLKNATGK